MKSNTVRNDSLPYSSLQIYLGEINDTPLLSAQEERDLSLQISEGDPYARERMVKANLRLVVNIARGYLGKGMSFEDLVEEGNLGLLRAVEGFDGQMETRFSTYASYWIKQSIRRAVMNNPTTLRLPAYMVNLLAKWKRAAQSLADSLGRAPSSEEVGKALGLSPKKIKIVDEAIRAKNLSPFNEGPSDGDGFVLETFLIDDRSKAPQDIMIDNDDMSRIFHMVGLLDEREAAVVRMRFGLEPYSPMTLREIGEHLGLTRERVRQLESQALLKLTASLMVGSE